MVEHVNSLKQRDIEQAERQIIGIALRHPNSWPKIRDARPEWFRHWTDQQLWRAIQHCNDQNGGVAEAPVLVDVLQEMFGDEAAGLATRANDIACEFLHADLIDFDLALLKHSGERLAIRRQAQVVVEMCDSRKAMSAIRDVLAQPPIGNGGRS